MIAADRLSRLSAHLERLKLVIRVRLAYERLVEAQERRWLEGDSLEAMREVRAARAHLKELNRALAVVMASAEPHPPARHQPKRAAFV